MYCQLPVVTCSTLTDVDADGGVQMEVYCQLPVVTCSALTLTPMEVYCQLPVVTCSALMDVDADGGVLSVTCGYL